MRKKRRRPKHVIRETFRGDGVGFDLERRSLELQKVVRNSLPRPKTARQSRRRVLENGRDDAVQRVEKGAEHDDVRFFGHERAR